VAHQQSVEKQKTKYRLKDVVVVADDYAKNYSYIVQYSFRMFHWKNKQATTHPSVCYFKNPTSAKELLAIPLLCCYL
jgi:hypothetical protein